MKREGAFLHASECAAPALALLQGNIRMKIPSRACKSICSTVLASAASPLVVPSVPGVMRRVSKEGRQFLLPGEHFAPGSRTTGE